MISRREPLLWLQLMALAVIPLELELLRLVLAGPGFGPAPALERLLIWGLAVIAPGVLLWRRPADWASLLLVRVSPAQRTVDQRLISAIQQPLGLKAALVIGIALMLPLFWWIDRSALLVIDFSPTSNSSRLTALLLAGPLLTLILWQWQQLVQAVWLLTRNDQTFEALTPLNPAELQSSHLSLGLGLLLPSPLEWESANARSETAATEASGADDAQNNQAVADSAPDPQPDPDESDGEGEAPEAGQEEADVISAEPENVDEASASVDSAAVEPEQSLDDPDSCNLKDQVSGDSATASTDQDIDQPLAPEPFLIEESEPAEHKADPEAPRTSLDDTELSSGEDEDEDEEEDDQESSAASVAVEPEQAPEEDYSPDLDSEISADGAVASTDAETHHEETKTTGGEQGDPEQPAQSPPGST